MYKEDIINELKKLNLCNNIMKSNSDKKSINLCLMKKGNKLLINQLIQLDWIKEKELLMYNNNEQKKIFYVFFKKLYED